MTRLQFLRIFFPEKCSLCGQIVPIEREHCSCYSSSINLAHQLCEHCGIKLEHCLCSRKDIIKLSHFTAPFYYEGAVKAKLHSLKFNSNKREAKYFIVPMVERFKHDFPDCGVDVVTFVPMSENECKKRGFNQSELFATQIALKLKLPCLELLEKPNDTMSQHKLNAEQRTLNLNGCFSAIPYSSGKTVLLIDDIKTTGRTLKECTITLLAAGAKDVYCLSAAVSNYHSGELFD